MCAQSLSCGWLFVTLWTIAHQASLFMGFSRQECWNKFLLQVIFPTQGSNPCFFGRWILYHWVRWELHAHNVCVCVCVASHIYMGFPGGTSGKEPACQWRRHKKRGSSPWIWVGSMGWEDPLEEATATHSQILAWKIPQTEEPGGLQSIVSQRVRHD